MILRPKKHWSTHNSPLSKDRLLTWALELRSHNSESNPHQVLTCTAVAGKKQNCPVHIDTLKRKQVLNVGTVQIDKQEIH